jgi:hypothetical protein
MYAFKGSYIPVAVYFVFTGLVSLLAILGVKDVADVPVPSPILPSEAVPSEAD